MGKLTSLTFLNELAKLQSKLLFVMRSAVRLFTLANVCVTTRFVLILQYTMTPKLQTLHVTLKMST